MSARKKLAPFYWYGGKFSKLAWILPHLPKCWHYVSVFGGSGADLLNRAPSPVETFNDIDGEITNFFRVLRDKEESLLRVLALTPFSREEFAAACEPVPEAELSDVERARRFFVRARQVRLGLCPKGERRPLGVLHPNPARHGRD